MNLKSLAKDTALYGLVSIVGRFLNYLLVPLHTYKIAAESGGYGIVSNLYAYTALFLALLTFGMETTLFRFANKQGTDDRMVFSSALRMVGGVGLGFLAIVFLLLHPISGAMGYEAHPEYVGIFALITAQDAFQAIMFSRLRQQRRPLRFVALKFAFIIPSILLNLFIFLVMNNIPALQGIFVQFNYGVGLIFVANLICTTLVTLLFIPEIKGIAYGFDKQLAKQMLGSSWPLLLLSLVGVLNQVADQILLPKLMPGEEGLVQLGIYGACVK
ncbi:MAG: oligosaccharide flippase family protein, partial [Bacteroidales bacterium]|nr:oligosaccharide flippase family protein [Bacteroidales bacterium]